MCGRFALNASGEKIARALEADDIPESTASFNIPPGTHQLVACLDDDLKVRFEALWWGFRPPWAGEDAPRPINARAEKVARSPFFRDAFARRRCLIPATGWYEWQNRDGEKQPHYVTNDSDLMWFAGIYDPPRTDREGCFAIITQPAARPIAHLHPRMPLVLDPGCLRDWLDPSRQEREAVKAVTRPLAPARLRAWPVDPRVNRPANDDAGLIEPLG